VLRFLLWRLLGLLALLVGLATLSWLLGGGPGRLLRAAPARRATSDAASSQWLPHWPQAVWDWAPIAGIRIVALMIVIVLVQTVALLAIRWVARSRRSYVRVRLEPHRTDQASAEAVARMHDVVQFLDGRGGRPESEASGEDASGGGDRELVGVGAEDLDVTF
jgi:hypothetical protein